LQCVVGAFAAQMPAGEAMQLRIDQWRQFLERLLIAAPPLFQQLRDLVLRAHL